MEEIPTLPVMAGMETGEAFEPEEASAGANRLVVATLEFRTILLQERKEQR